MAQLYLSLDARALKLPGIGEIPVMVKRVSPYRPSDKEREEQPEEKVQGEKRTPLGTVAHFVLGCDRPRFRMSKEPVVYDTYSVHADDRKPVDNVNSLGLLHAYFEARNRYARGQICLRTNDPPRLIRLFAASDGLLLQRLIYSGEYRPNPDKAILDASERYRRSPDFGSFIGQARYSTPICSESDTSIVVKTPHPRDALIVRVAPASS